METEEKSVVKEQTAENEKKGFFSKAWKKTVEITKKTAGGVKKGVTTLAEKNKQKKEQKELDKLQPLFEEEYKSPDFHLPNIIKIVDDAERRDKNICDGAIGWREKINDVEVLFLYDEYADRSGIEFVPVWRCDNTYCVDSFDRNRYIETREFFNRENEERIAELENIAYCLGAKYCSIEIVESDKAVTSKKASIFMSKGKSSAKANASQDENYTALKKNKKVTRFNGHSQPKKPPLKWFAHDDNMNGLIEKCCNDVNAIKSTVLELSGACRESISKKTACAIDNLLNMNGNTSMEVQAEKAYNRKLVFEIEF